MSCLSTERTSEWARQDLNLQPTDYESAALTRLSYGPQLFPTGEANGHKTGLNRTAPQGNRRGDLD